MHVKIASCIVHQKYRLNPFTFTLSITWRISLLLTPQDMECHKLYFKGVRWSYNNIRRHIGSFTYVTYSRCSYKTTVATRLFEIAEEQITVLVQKSVHVISHRSGVVDKAELLTYTITWYDMLRYNIYTWAQKRTEASSISTQSQKTEK